ncbi:sensor histidine kinase [Methylobacterium sp. E-066]|uniref:sensor histidine kinase n=1 Tax=Methylobacterium sp. E-066 TaxID=2836584 RepID=UPI001FB89C67|nr:HAMP domain-containing sensor histidine kinase [Methylobacterium sp. E-066]MCJ2143210.1 ATP-binding protein [Methylobacterium sp. E-066]
MSEEEPSPALRIGAHVLIQLGSELVTDVEQAILECVKNAYDADSPSCRIEVSTTEVGVRVEPGSSDALGRFRRNAKNVRVEIRDAGGDPVAEDAVLASGTAITRHLRYTGRVTIEDSGEGLTRAQLRSSWLVISGSVKRVTEGPKPKTVKLRTPLGDKGLGRLGSMKLGDILLIETATSKDGPLEVAQFRWADCETARTVDQIPVMMTTEPNPGMFKGTRVSVLGLHNLKEWTEGNRATQITRGLARLISPFEAKATFRVTLGINGPEQSLTTVTDDVLNKAIAQFTFDWIRDKDTGVLRLVSTAKFRRRLFAPTRKGKMKDKSAEAFLPDNGKAFSEFLLKYPRMKQYDTVSFPQDGSWFAVLTNTTPWVELIVAKDEPVEDPGPFEGAFYYYHLETSGSEDLQSQSIMPLDRELIREMAGVTILRDGFRVRSQGDWLGLAEGMTSGSTYQMRVNNTVGYFNLTGEHNYRLTEKSDREGFVENAAFRGFMQVALRCRIFANEALENVRRGFDDHHRNEIRNSVKKGPITAEASLDLMERGRRTAEDAKVLAETAADFLSDEIAELEKQSAAEDRSDLTAKALRVARDAYVAFRDVESRLKPDEDSHAALRILQLQLDENKDRISSLFEAAAVGMSARGLAHELRTHLTEIQQRVVLLEKSAKSSGIDATLLPNLRAIRGACTEIRKAAALIDPMMPRVRAAKETFSLETFVTEYLSNRAATFERAGIRTEVTTRQGPTIRTNRSRLLQVLDNLVRNSTYWLSRGEAEAGIVREKVVAVEIGPTGFIVSDTGPGVAPRYEDSLFEIFVTGKTDGATGQGLGLFIAQNLLQAEGCDIVLLPDRNPEGRLYRFGVNLSPVIVEGR